jgi:excinuclease ABC subunit A
MQGLQNISESISVGKFDDIVGAKYIDGIEIVDQSPIEITGSDPSSYAKAFEQSENTLNASAKAKGYKPGYFSFNVPGGRCETCQGDGYIKVEMQFLADLYLTCDDCGGTRFKKEIREITYRGKNLVNVLEMTL